MLDHQGPFKIVRPYLVPILWLIVLPALLLKQVQAQSASSTINSTHVVKYAYLNGGGFDIGSSAGLAYSDPLNAIEESKAGPIFIKINGNVVYDGVPDRLENLNENGSLYTQKLNPNLANSKLNLNKKKTVAVRIGGTIPTYKGLRYESINSTITSVRPTSYSVFPSFFPTVFRRPSQ